MAKVEFFKQAPAQKVHEDPVIPWCDNPDCLDQANPAWSDGLHTFCRNCAPPDLKNPEQYLRGLTRDDSTL